MSEREPHARSTEGLKGARTFSSPSGREWIVGVFELPSGVGVRTPNGTVTSEPVLRFTSGDITLDLTQYPNDWTDRSGEELVSLLRLAAVPTFVPLSASAE